MKPLSVVIPSYNYARFLPQAVASVARQDYPGIELVIIDDKSTDDSVDVIHSLREQYRESFGSINIILNDSNRGAHAAINAGIDAASGELIAVLNADDMYEDKRFTAMVEAMGSARFAFSAVACVDADGNVLSTPEAQSFSSVQRGIENAQFMALAAVAENIAVSTGNMLFEKSLFKELSGFKNYKYVHDYDFLLRALLVAEPVYVPATHYLYRLHGDNTFTKLKKEGLIENRIVWLDFYNAVKKGRINNSAILSHPNYIALFEQSVASYGDKKHALWRMGANPFVRAGVSFTKKIHKYKK